MVIRLGKAKRRDNLPAILPWEERHSESSNRKRIAAILVLCLLCLGVGFSAGFQVGVFHVHDPPTTITTDHVNNDTKTKTTIPRPPVTPQPNASFTWLTGTIMEIAWMLTACNSCNITFTNPNVGSLPAALRPTYSTGSGWYALYGLYVVSGLQYNVTLSNCAGGDLGAVTSNSNGTLSFSPDNPRTMTFTPSGSDFRQDAECGVY